MLCSPMRGVGAPTGKMGGQQAAYLVAEGPASSAP